MSLKRGHAADQGPGHPSSTARAPWVDRAARRFVHARLGSIHRGHLRVVDDQGESLFGEADSTLRCTLTVENPHFYRKLLTRGPLGGGESFVDGDWRSDDLTTLVRILSINRDSLENLNSSLALVTRPLLALQHWLRDNNPSGSRKNIAAHYDLGNEFFELFLDPTLTYSSGIFESDAASMEEASTAKLDRLCRKLRLEADDRVLEIGTGWGGFAIHAARKYRCHVTTTTISLKQHELARKRVAEAGLEGRVEVLLEDYRELRGEYDKLVSIEMIEAVGHRNLESFFGVCGDRLRADGAMGLQLITVPDQKFEHHLKVIDFIREYIFPGGDLVSVGAMNGAVANASDLRMTHFEDITPHYAETLRHWRLRMFENLDRLREQGLDDSFLRMWEYYLAYCEGGFRERQIGVAQVVFEKPEARRASLLGALA